jgi:hypothetical protein
MANEVKVKKGSTVYYTPFEDDSRLTGVTPGKITNIHDDGTVDIEFKQGKAKKGELSDTSVTRQFVPENEDGAFNTWSSTKKEDTGTTETDPAEEDTTGGEKDPQDA